MILRKKGSEKSIPFASSPPPPPDETFFAMTWSLIESREHTETDKIN